MTIDFETYMTKRILEDHGFNLSDQEIQILVENKFWNKAKKTGIVAALTAASLMPQTSKASQPEQQAKTPVVKKITSSKEASRKSDVNKFWTKQGNTYSPIKGNGVLVKTNEFVGVNSNNPNDQYDSTLEFTPVETQDQFQIVTGKGSGSTYDTALNDALAQAVGYAVGVKIDSKETFRSGQTIVGKNNQEKVSDEFDNYSSKIQSNKKGVVGEFKVVKVAKDKYGITNVEIQAKVQKFKNQRTLGFHSDYRLDNQGKFRMNKQTFNL